MLPLLLLSLLAPATAHEHHEHVPESAKHDPIDSILWIHILLQFAVWGVLFPVGMVLGLTRSKWHVPLQTTGFLLTFGGYILGHSHKGRAFPEGAHGSYANILLVPILTQLVVGIYLKLHIHEKSIRPYFVVVHGILGKSYPVLGWVQIIIGYATWGGYCRGGHLGQCLAHYIMGSAFIGYGVVLTIILLVGEHWMRRTGKSPDFFDSCVITAWGIVNTFTEHHGSLTTWSHKDMQHTILGVLWWTGGALGMYLSRNNQRSVVPALIIILTGWAMSDHAQALMISTKVHAMFGITLMLAGLARILEVVYFNPGPSSTGEAEDSDNSSEHTLAEGLRTTSSSGSSHVAGARAFRYLTPFLLVASGILFISAIDEELSDVQSVEMDHVTYVLIAFSFAFLLYTFIVLCVNVYSTTGRHSSSQQGFAGGALGGGAVALASALPDESAGGIELSVSRQGGKWGNGYARVPSGNHAETAHVLGDDEDEEDEMARNNGRPVRGPR